MDRARHHAFGQLDKMAAYPRSGCQRHTLLSYFGETPPWERCGRCTGCDAGRAMVTEAKPLDEGQLQVVIKILACMARMKRPFSTSMIAKVVTGSRDKAVRAWEFEKLSTWGLLRGTPQTQIEAILGAMEAGGLIEVSLTSKPVRGQTRTWKNLALTRLGGDVMRGDTTDVCLAMPSTGPSMSRSFDAMDAHDGAVDDDLLEQLRRVRWRLAQGDDVPAYVVASNRTLMGIAMVRPTSLDALSAVHGMGKQRISKYGKPFVEAVRSWTGC